MAAPGLFSRGKTEEDDMNRKARAVWRGTGKDGEGRLESDSGVLMP